MFSNDQQPTLAFTESYKKMGTKRKASHQSKAHKQIKHVKERYKALFNIPRLREEQFKFRNHRPVAIHHLPIINFFSMASR
jgi:hypothetical protein